MLTGEFPSKNCVSICTWPLEEKKKGGQHSCRYMPRLIFVSYVRTLAGIIWDSGAASMTDCHVLVEPGITKPKTKFHSMHEK